MDAIADTITPHNPSEYSVGFMAIASNGETDSRIVNQYDEGKD